MYNEKKEIKVYVSKQQHAELKAFCATLGVSMSCFVDHAIREKINKELKKNNETTSLSRKMH